MQHRVQGWSLIFILCVLFPIFAANTARAEEVPNGTIAALQAQINSLQAQLNDLKAEKTAAAPIAAQAQDQKAVADASAEKITNNTPPTNSADKPTGTGQSVKGNSKIKVTVGGFVAAEAVERSKNETTDIGSNFNTLIPFDNSVNAHQREFRGTARQSRLTLLAEGNADANTKLSGYVESDFLGAAPTANSNESNSYNPRLRVLYATVDKSDWGMHVLAGQNWSLLTMNKVGITPRNENVPLTIDAQYVPGFNWTRNPQIRVVQDFDDKKIAAGISLESPQVNFGSITVPGGVNATNTGNSALSTGAYSTDFAPDVIAKVAADPGFGHYEFGGIARFFHDNVGTTDFHNNSKMGEGLSVAAILPVVPKKLDVQASVLTGRGIGRYGSAQLPDFAFAPGGGIHPLYETTFLVGAIAHPDPTLDVYLYGGAEIIQRDNEPATTFGYGDLALNNSGCNISGGACAAQTSSVWQITPGFWKQLYKGEAGTVKFGLQDSLTRRNTFSDGAGLGPHAYENIVMTSFRYYPF